jgi:hypothetical protein
MTTDQSERALIERLVKQPVADATHAVWGFTNRTDIVTLAAGDRVVIQRFRRRHDAVNRLRVMRALWTPAAEAGITIPRIRESDLDANPPWVIYDALPGIAIPEAGGDCPPPGSSSTICGPILTASPLARNAGFRRSLICTMRLEPPWRGSSIGCLRNSRIGLSCSPTVTSRP